MEEKKTKRMTKTTQKRWRKAETMSGSVSNGGGGERKGTKKNVRDN